MVPVSAVLADFIASRILEGDRCDPAEPEIGSEVACTSEVIEHGDTVIPSADCFCIILISPHSFTEGTLRLEVVERRCLAADEPKEFAHHAALHPGGAASAT
jgi:hypothetical protein